MIATNPTIGELGAHPFPRLNALLVGQRPPDGETPIDLTIGEPRFAPPASINALITAYGEHWGSYPPNDGPAWFRDAAARWLERRFNLPPGAVASDAVIPTAGAREALYQIGFLPVRSGDRPFFVMPTPHYAPYRAAALMAGLQPLYLAGLPETGYLPDLDVVEGHATRIAAMLVASPSNPEGAIAAPDYLAQAIRLAREHHFLLVVDECYSELYLDEPPTGALEVCWRLRDGRSDQVFDNVLVVNSLSKRSSAAGLRVGFVAGDRTLIRALVALRAYGGGTTPVPNLGVAAQLLADEAHVADLRAGYRTNFAIADQVLCGLPGYRRPSGGMFLWLRVADGEQVAAHLWRTAGLRVMPGSYLGPSGQNGENPGASHIRVALVHPPEVIREALTRLAPTLSSMGVG